VLARPSHSSMPPFQHQSLNPGEASGAQWCAVELHRLLGEPHFWERSKARAIVLASAQQGWECTAHMAQRTTSTRAQVRQLSLPSRGQSPVWPRDDYGVAGTHSSDMQISPKVQTPLSTTYRGNQPHFQSSVLSFSIRRLYSAHAAKAACVRKLMQGRPPGWPTAMGRAPSC